jgi:hypothetical protein
VPLAVTRSTSKHERPTPLFGEGNEILGRLLLVRAVLLGLAFGSYRPLGPFALPRLSHRVVGRGVFVGQARRLTQYARLRIISDI